VRKKVYRRRRKKPRLKKWPFILVAVVLLLAGGLTLSVVLGFNPLLESRLRAQFGDAFFSDFGITRPVEAGGDLESILNNYEPVFVSLQDEAISRLDDLMEQGLEEYRREERRGTLDQFSLSNKYIQAGRMLEKNVDQLFYDLLDNMKSDLAANGYSTDIAVDIEERYISAKEAKKKELFDRLRNHL
jgi:hypothetical protein